MDKDVSKILRGSLFLGHPLVQLLAKFEPPVIVRRTLQAGFGQDTPTESIIRKIYQCFYESGTVEDRQRFGGPSTITEEKSMKPIMFVRANQTQVFELLQLFAQFHEQQYIESQLNISH